MRRNRAEPPGRDKIMEISKEILRKFQKMDYFRRFFKIIKKIPVLNFRALDEKHNSLGFFEQTFKGFFENSTKCIILVYFQNDFKPTLYFPAFGRNTQLVGKYLRKSSNISFENSKNALF